MKNIIVLFLALTISSSLFAQASLNINMLANEDPSSTSYNDVWGYTAPTGEEYAIIGTRDQIFIYDVTDCANPVQVLSFTGTSNTTWRDFKTYKNYVYGVCDSCSEGLQIFDMSSVPSGNPVHVNTITSYFGSSHNIYIDAGRLYVLGVGGSQDVIILDIDANPTNPPLIANVDLSTVANNTCATCYVHDMYVENHIAYASHGWEEVFTVYDFSDPNNVTYLNSVNIPGGYNHSSWLDISRSYAYVALEVPSGLPMQTVDLANLNNPVNDLSVVGTFRDDITDIGTTPHNPFVCDDHLFISYYEDGLKIYDISNPAAPTLQGYYDTDPGNIVGSWGVYPFFESGCIIATDIANGMFTLESTTPGVTGDCSGECPEITSLVSNVTGDQCDTGSGLSINYTANVNTGINGVDYEIIWRVDGVVQSGTGDTFTHTINNNDACNSIAPEVGALLRCFPNQTTPLAEVFSTPVQLYSAPIQGVEFTVTDNDCTVSINDQCGSLIITNDQGTGNSYSINPGDPNQTVIFTIKGDSNAPTGCETTVSLTASCACPNPPALTSITSSINTDTCIDGVSDIIYTASVSSGINGINYEILWEINGIPSSISANTYSFTIDSAIECGAFNPPMVNAQLVSLCDNTMGPQISANSSFTLYPLPQENIHYEVLESDCTVEIIDLCGSLQITNNLNNSSSYTLPQGDPNTKVSFQVASDVNAPASCIATESLVSVCPCPSILLLSGTVTGVADEEVSDYLESEQILAATSKVDYDAANSILLKPGFEVILGAEFMAFIDGCNQGGGGINLVSENIIDK